jgi:hypothetical protein
LSAARSIRARSWVAVIAAYALVLQAFFGSALLGQSLTPTLLDKAIHLTLCAPGAERVPLPGDQSPPHLPACCQSGCSALALAYAPPPARTVLLSPPVPPGAPLAFDAPTHPRLPGNDRLASRPRGPPSLA